MSWKPELKEAFERQAEWRREKAIEYPSDDRNEEAAKLFDKLAESVDLIDEVTLDVYWELLEELKDTEVHQEMMRTVGFSYWPDDAARFVADFIAARTGGA